MTSNGPTEGADDLIKRVKCAAFKNFPLAGPGTSCSVSLTPGSSAIVSRRRIR